MPICVSHSVSERQEWREETSTVVVNAHGALILLNHDVEVGQMLKLSDVKTGDGRPCRVVMIGTRLQGLVEVGVELLAPFNDFWRTTNPPSDWAQFCDAAKTAIHGSADKMNS